MPVLVSVAYWEPSLHWVCGMGSINLKISLVTRVFVGSWTEQGRVKVVKYPYGSIWDNLRVDDKLIGLS